MANQLFKRTVKISIFSLVCIPQNLQLHKLSKQVMTEVGNNWILSSRIIVTSCKYIQSEHEKITQQNKNADGKNGAENKDMRDPHIVVDHSGEMHFKTVISAEQSHSRIIAVQFR